MTSLDYSSGSYFPKKTTIKTGYLFENTFREARRGEALISVDGMNEFSHNVLACAIIGILYMVLVALFALIMTRRGNRLLVDIRKRGPEGLWEELGSPTTLKEAFENRNFALRKFIRSGEYRTRCDPMLAAGIDDYKRITNVGLAALALLGLAIFYVFWPLLKTAVP